MVVIMTLICVEVAIISDVGIVSLLTDVATQATRPKSIKRTEADCIKTKVNFIIQIEG